MTAIYTPYALARRCLFSAKRFVRDFTLDLKTIPSLGLSPHKYRSFQMLYLHFCALPEGALLLRFPPTWAAAQSASQQPSWLPLQLREDY